MGVRNNTRKEEEPLVCIFLTKLKQTQQDYDLFSQPSTMQPHASAKNLAGPPQKTWSLHRRDKVSGERL